MTKFTEEVANVISLLELENNLVRARNERLEKEVEQLQQQIAKLQEEKRASGRLWEMVRDS